MGCAVHGGSARSIVQHAASTPAVALDRLDDRADGDLGGRSADPVAAAAPESASTSPRRPRSPMIAARKRTGMAARRGDLANAEAFASLARASATIARMA
jgi:hypothetical protein